MRRDARQAIVSFLREEWQSHLVGILDAIVEEEARKGAAEVYDKIMERGREIVAEIAAEDFLAEIGLADAKRKRRAKR